MPTSAIRWFKSKLDPWLAVVLVVVPLIQLVALVGALRSGNRDGVNATAFGVGFVALIYAVLVIPVRYGISEDSLLVHFGVVRQRIRFDAIREVRPSRSPLSSPALSLDRLAIKTGRGPLHLTLISPSDREVFIGLLSEKAGLVWDGRRWVPQVATGR